MPYPSLKVLLIEDDESDILTARRIFDRIPFHTKVTIANNGKDALKILGTDEDSSSDQMVPFNLLLIDITLPDICGFDVLKEIRIHPRLRFIPAIILTGSKDADDIVLSYASGANNFMEKPLTEDKLMNIVTALYFEAA